MDWNRFSGHRFALFHHREIIFHQNGLFLAEKIPRALTPLVFFLQEPSIFLFVIGIQISLLKDGDVTSLCSFHKISGPSICS